MLLVKFIKFCIVGFSGLVIDFGVTYLFKEKAKFNKYIANAIGFICAASSNYVINRIWTFQSHGQIIRQYLSFVSISAVGLLINTLILMYLVKKMKQNFYVAKFISILIVTIWNFCLNLLITFV
ncbi:MAG: glycosyl transferase family 2 [Bacteroidetes bacterium GWE2_29_8]|nr:MAG: glycosyl transferase family 2 [Bacteroidetes bacterium GWE2_29_8]OFY25308.1 MAG: glycosyl transferase family 2 [Bacteroidetes bacterium GWF2_29_10]